MAIHTKLLTLREQQGLSQQAMAERIGIHINSWKKYESGQAQPSMDALRKIALTLHVSADFLLFDEHERGMSEELKSLFDAVGALAPQDQALVRDVLDALVTKFQVQRNGRSQKAGADPKKHAAAPRSRAPARSKR